MHEWGLVADAVAEVKKQAALNKIIKVTAIQIGLGRKSDVSKEGFQTCFTALAKDTIMSEAKLQFKSRPDHIITVDTISGQTD